MKKAAEKSKAGKIIAILVVVVLALAAIALTVLLVCFPEEGQGNSIEIPPDKGFNEIRDVVRIDNSTMQIDCTQLIDPDVGDYYVEIVPYGSTASNFDFTVDGKSYEFNKIALLTTAFDIQKAENVITIRNTAKSMGELLQRVFGSGEIVINAELSQPSYFTAVITSGKNIARIDLQMTFWIELEKIILDKEQIIL